MPSDKINQDKRTVQTKRTELDNVLKLIKEYSGEINTKNQKTMVFLAGGQGKRIKSNVPKVLHPIWGIPALKRLIDVVSSSLKTDNQVIIVGNKADEVIKSLGKAKNRVYVHQAEQLGTGHAVQQAVKAIPKDYSGDVFSFPGDLGLINKKTIQNFYKKYSQSKSKMFLLTGIYNGADEKNHYGRILRDDQRNILDIVQFKDIVNLKKGATWPGLPIKKEELLAIKEFDSGIFVFHFPELLKHIFSLNADNIQKEYYLTDLVKIYSDKKIPFDSYSIPEMDTLTGFNDKTILKKVENIFKQNYYNQLKNIISIEDENNFFIEERIIKKIIALDKKSIPLDINVKSGIHLSGNVQLGQKINIGKNSHLSGNIIIHKNVTIGNNVHITTFPHQKVVLKDGVEISGNSVIKGNVVINERAKIGEGVNITGSDQDKTTIGKNVSLHGSCYIYGCKIENEAEIESSILVKKKVKCIKLNDGKVQPIKFIIPPPVGTMALKDI